jgi:hypothetical protein
VIDTGGASLGVMIAAGGIAGAEGKLVSDFVAGRSSSPSDVAFAAAEGASASMLAASVGALSQAASTMRTASEPALRPDIQLSGGRSGSNVKNLTGPANSIVKGGPGHAFRTDSQSRVVADITAQRVKPVTPGQGFGEKQPPTQQELGWLRKLYRDFVDN